MRIFFYSFLPPHRPKASLRLLGIEAEHVPLGFAPSLSDLLPGAKLQTTRAPMNLEYPPPLDPQIDVLFYGTSTPRRLEIIAELRAAVDHVDVTEDSASGDMHAPHLSLPPPSLRVVHANAANFGTFGKDLDMLVMDSKIVLNLLTCTCTLQLMTTAV